MGSIFPIVYLQVRIHKMHPLVDRIKGLYVIADTATIEEELFIEKAAIAIAAGCQVLQYRDKSNDQGKRLRQARQLYRLCKEAGSVFIINDDAELAIQANADGVHCGKNDTAVSDIRHSYPDLLIGASCYDSVQRAKEMIAAGADYVAFGRFFPSTTKPGATPANIDVLRQAKQHLKCPVVAIGGIMAENAGILISSGADAVAVIGGVFNTPDVHHSSKKICELFTQREHQALSQDDAGKLGR